MGAQPGRGAAQRRIPSCVPVARQEERRKDSLNQAAGAAVPGDSEGPPQSEAARRTTLTGLVNTKATRIGVSPDISRIPRRARP